VPESIEVGVNVVTGDSVENLEEVRDVAKEAGEAVDDLDQKSASADVDVSETGAAAAETALDDVTAAAQTADAQTVVVEVSETGGTAAAASLDDVARAGGDTSNVMGNLTGNAAQDLANVAGVSGTAGTALGQLAETAFDGGVALRSLAAGGAGIAGVGIAIEYVTGLLNVMKEADAWDEKKVNEYRDAILEGVDAVEALQEALTEAQGVSVREVAEGGLAALPWGDKTVIKDITADVIDLGLNVQTFSQLAASSTSTIDSWGQAQIEAGADAQQVQTVVLALRQEHERLDTAIEASKVSQQFLNTAMGDTSKLSANERAVQNVIDAYQRLAVIQAQVAAAAANVAAAAPSAPSAPRGTPNPRATTVNNFYPAAPSPMELAMSAREYQRIQGGPV